jgi:hypothetical protein
MLSWIAGYVGRWSGQVASEVRSLVQWGLHALAGVVYTVFGNVGKAWGWLLTSLQWMHAQADLFAGWVVTHLVQIVTVDIPRLARDAVNYYDAAIAFAGRVWSDAQAAVARALQLAQQYVADALNWVRVNVYDPLFAAAKQLETDLLKWGYYAYQLLTHPATLAGLLLDYLIAAAEAAFDRIAVPAGTFALRLITSQLPRFLKLAEAILTAVL